MNKKHAPTVYRVYDYISAFCKGESKSISAIDLANAVGLNIEGSESNRKRAIRLIVNKIRNDCTFDNVIASGNQGYWWSESQDPLLRLKAQGLSCLKAYWAGVKKAEMNGQMRIKVTPYEREIYESLCEVEL